MLGKQPRLLAALDLVAAKSDWGKPLPARVGRGGMRAAFLWQFYRDRGRSRVDSHGEVMLRRITTVVDAGIVVNPDTVEAPGGIGETGTTAGPPALRNAIFAATGIALKRLPIDRDVLAGRTKA
jgi:isoquinoline 1-oxidoreductase beta subunit